ncbi:hypothetical protein C8R46DRAFT_147936 [Mycena filopes]|nr:hypothetical protein C8R46DRAFT_147936 [Mycena filopes]
MHSTAPFRIEGKGFKLAVLLGNPRHGSIGVHPTHVAFNLDDGTGVIRVNVWTDLKTRTQQLVQILECPYVRAIGSLKTFQGVKTVTATNVFAARDPHEVYEHILKTIQETMIYRIGPPPSNIRGLTPEELSNESPQPQGSELQSVTTTLDAVAQLNSPIRSLSLESPRGPPFFQSPRRDPYGTLSVLERKIIDALRELTDLGRRDSNGVPIEALFCSLHEQIGVDKPIFLTALAFLVEEGFIYRPILDSHCLLNE